MFWRSFCPENVRAVFVWLGGVARDGDIIRFDNNGASRFFCFDFPVLAGTLPRRRAAPGGTCSRKECAIHKQDSLRLIKSEG